MQHPNPTWTERPLIFTPSTGIQTLGPRTNPTASTRTIITAQQAWSHNVFGRVNAVYTGTFHARPAILLITQFTFREKRASLDDVTVTLTFTPQPPVPAGLALPLAVRLFSPRRLLGRPNKADETLTYSGLLSAGTHAGPATAGPALGVTKTTTRTRERRLEIRGYESVAGEGDQPNQVVFRVRRNGADMFPETVYLGVVVERHMDIQADVHVDVNRVAFSLPWRRDAPLLLPVGDAGERCLPVGSGGPAVGFEALGEEEWRGLVPYVRDDEEIVIGS